ncbi:MAG: AMP-dependent synthetase [Deltaproteobacteria bacterium]|nr:AMP-dependent synthetase [Deltaproteobacteria bacterium]
MAVAWDREGVRTWREFSEHAAGLAGQLGRGTSWVVDCASSYAFAVALFATARAGALAWVPPNRQPGTVGDLAARSDGLLSDGSEEPGALHPLALSAKAAACDLPEDRAALHLFTSGTTGSAKEIPKTWRQLDEVAELERCFGSGLPASTRVFSTAPHHHLYGLLFRVLWPLASGRPFQAETLLHVEELLPRIAEGPPAMLAATPAHLRRITQREELARLRGHLVRVFSSGGPLPASTAAAVEIALGEPPVEVFGSTESGGVALRSQRSGEPPPSWRPLAPVRVRRDAETGCLRVTSPWVSLGAEQADGQLELEMGDRVEIAANGEFRLLGRADRVVKIGEKRVVLLDMESRLLEHGFVDEVALVDVERGGDARVGALVVLSAEGRAVHEREGRRELGRALGDHLAPHWDRVVLPRIWRVVPALPRDERGKLPREALLAELAERPRSPLVLGEERAGDVLCRELRVPEDLAQLEGHFPDLPVVPGVAQVGWALAAAEVLLGRPLQAHGVEALKFKEPLRPGTSLSLEVEANPDDRAKGRFRFRCTREGRELSSGRVKVEP